MKVPADCSIQCPWCDEVIPAEQWFSKLPPLARLLDADGNPLQVDSANAFGDIRKTDMAKNELCSVDPSPSRVSLDDESLDTGTPIGLTGLALPSDEHDESLSKKSPVVTLDELSQTSQQQDELVQKVNEELESLRSDSLPKDVPAWMTTVATSTGAANSPASENEVSLATGDQQGKLERPQLVSHPGDQAEHRQEIAEHDTASENDGLAETEPQTDRRRPTLEEVEEAWAESESYVDAEDDGLAFDDIEGFDSSDDGYEDDLDESDVEYDEEILLTGAAISDQGVDTSDRADSSSSVYLDDDRPYYRSNGWGKQRRSAIRFLKIASPSLLAIPALVFILLQSNINLGFYPFDGAWNPKQDASNENQFAALSGNGTAQNSSGLGDSLDPPETEDGETTIPDSVIQQGPIEESEFVVSTDDASDLADAQPVVTSQQLIDSDAKVADVDPPFQSAMDPSGDTDVFADAESSNAITSTGPTEDDPSSDTGSPAVGNIVDRQWDLPMDDVMEELKNNLTPFDGQMDQPGVTVEMIAKRQQEERWQRRQRATEDLDSESFASSVSDSGNESEVNAVPDSELNSEDAGVDSIAKSDAASTIDRQELDTTALENPVRQASAQSDVEQQSLGLVANSHTPIADAGPVQDINPLPSDIFATDPSHLEAAESACLKVVESLESLHPSDQNDRQATIANLKAYREVCRLVDVEGIADAPSLKAVLHQVAEKPIHRQFTSLSGAWIQWPKRQTKGVLLLGKVETEDGQTTLRFDDGSQVALEHDFGDRRSLVEGESIVGLAEIISAESPRSVRLIEIVSGP
ncbi:hypothetical protein ACMFWY_09825 [Roseiconus sp. JC912]